ncbi:protein asteroid-like [Leguminivora glycinivorella]|uniref:protein asteroid-like n=1 Tax=Leguminivora glycinivorella TaxID=1035111 RepID=UPI00200ED8AF|nr:protein asteroid-like [Leguminivora glycinivorella]
MGVRGLTTYINYNQKAFLRDHLLHDTNLVIDGHSLCAQLYRLLNSFSAFGGDYDKFAAYVKTFFKNLRKCNITPYVIFDGAYERRKLKTAYSRLKARIRGASELDPVTQSSLQIFPILLRDTFRDVLVEMGIAYTVCEFEADDEIAAMARHLDCPVLSYDSDFFIYNVLYIPFNTIELKPTPIGTKENGEKINALECKMYKVEYMLKHFGGLEDELLPLLATLLGNDYVQKRVFNKFFSQLKLPKSKKKKNDQQRCIHGLFKWLQNETLESAIAKIIGRMKKNQKDRVFYIIKRSIEGYNSKTCNSLKYFNIGHSDDTESTVELNMPESDENESEQEEEQEKELSDDDSNDDDDKSSSGESIQDEQLVLGVPEWYAERLRTNFIPQPYLNLYVHHLHFCAPQAEDYTDEDSFICTLPIMRYAFDLLTDFSEDYCIYVSRDGLNYKRIFVNKEYSICRLFDSPFYELTEEQLKQCFVHFIKEKMPKLDLTVLEDLPSNFRIYMIAILWWVLQTKPPLAHVLSLLTCYVTLEVIDEKTGTFRGHNHFNNKYSKKIEELKRLPVTSNTDEIFLNRNKVQYEDCLLAASVLLKHFEIDASINKKPKSYDAKKMHSFARFQCCLLQLNSLNNLCYNPYEATKYWKSFNGTFVYNIALALEHQMEPYLYLQQYIKGAGVLRFLKNLYEVYEKCAVAMDLETTKWMGKKRERRRRKHVSQDDDDFNHFGTKGFESEVII